MKVFVITSKQFYDHIPSIKRELEERGHIVTLPNSYDDPRAEERMKEAGPHHHAEWKAGMFKRSAAVIDENDAVLVLNFEKNGIPNYIGGATFLEMYEAFKLGKKIFLYNPIPDGSLRDEIAGFGPILLNGTLEIFT